MSNKRYYTGPFTMETDIFPWTITFRLKGNVPSVSAYNAITNEFLTAPADNERLCKLYPPEHWPQFAHKLVDTIENQDMLF